MVYRLPVHSCGFHGSDPAPIINQPLQQRCQSPHGGVECPVFQLDHASFHHSPQACCYACLMDIQTTTDRVNQFHDLPPCSEWGIRSWGWWSPSSDSKFLCAIKTRLIEVLGWDRPITARV